jgi:hypothetical protein
MNALGLFGFIGGRIRIETLQNLTGALSEFASGIVGESDQQNFTNT